MCGTFHTDSLHQSLPTEELQAEMAGHVSLGRIAGADEIVGTALFRERRCVLPQRRAARAGRRLMATDVVGPDRVAVVTGGGAASAVPWPSGFAAEGSAVVVADLEGDRAPAVAAGVAVRGRAEAVTVDVSDPAAVRPPRVHHDGPVRPGGRAVQQRRGLHLQPDRRPDPRRLALGGRGQPRGVVHGIHSFLPILREQGSPAHIVNTASIAGLLNGVAFIGPYAASKAAIVSISETLARSWPSRSCRSG